MPRSKNRKSKANGALIAAPVAINRAFKFPGSGRGKRSHRFRNRELIGDVTCYATANASVVSYRVNPGYPATFPYLSIEASEWEQYCFHALTFVYEPISTVSAAGTILLSPEYAVRDPQYVSEQQLANSQDAVEGAQWREIRCVLDVAAMFPTGPRKYVAEYLPPGYSNFDAALLRVFTSNAAADFVSGKLWVEYDVEFFVPAARNNVGGMNGALYLSNNDYQPMTSGTNYTVVWNSNSGTIVGVAVNTTTGNITLAPYTRIRITFSAACEVVPSTGFTAAIYVANVSGASIFQTQGNGLYVGGPPSVTVVERVCVNNDVVVWAQSQPATFAVIATMTGSGGLGRYSTQAIITILGGN